MNEITKKFSELASKRIKNKPLDENLIQTDDAFPYKTFEELKKNSKVLTQRDNNESLKSLIKQNGEDGNPIFVTDLSKLLNLHLKWMENLPTVKPCYAMKCNNDYMIVKTLKEFGCGFDCASMEEIRQALEVGVNPKHIIFANPIKPISHLKYAYEKGVDHMTFDNADELVKIKAFHPNAKLVIRIRVDDSKSVCQFGAKFGVHDGMTRELIEKVEELEMNLVGVSFHVGSGCGDPNAYYEAIKKAREIFDEAEEFNMKLTLLDIGGGFTSVDFDHHSKIIRQSLAHFFSDLNVKVIAEPGRYYANPTMNLAVHVNGRREIIDKKSKDNELEIENKSNYKDEIDTRKKFMYYVSDGTYGTFN
jgi:ornithine decarboxylase